MAEKKSIQVARNRLFLATDEVANLVPPTAFPLDYLDTWAGIMKHALSEVAEAVQQYKFAAEDARARGVERACFENAEGVSGS